MKANPTAVGEWGEWIALKHVRKLGWDVVARNWQGHQGEVDLIGYDGPSLVFVEVKTRRLPAPLPPEDNVGRKKERKLEALATEFVFRYEITGVPVRFDVIAIETRDLKKFRLRHWKNDELRMSNDE